MPESDDVDEDVEEDEEDRQRLADRVLSGVEDAVYWSIAVVLALGSVALLVAQFNTMLRLRNTPASTLMLEVLDGLLLLFIFVELLYAVRACLRSHEIVAEPFLSWASWPASRRSSCCRSRRRRCWRRGRSSPARSSRSASSVASSSFLRCPRSSCASGDETVTATDGGVVSAGALAG